MKKHKWKVIGRGFNGWHATSVEASLSGCYEEELPQRLVTDAEEGALVYDASEANAAAFTAHVISGPMLDVRLGDDEVDGLGAKARACALEMSPALGGAFRAYALACQDETFGGLDAVGRGVYEALLRRIGGVRFGRVVGGKVVWES